MAFNTVATKIATLEASLATAFTELDKHTEEYEIGDGATGIARRRKKGDIVKSIQVMNDMLEGLLKQQRRATRSPVSVAQLNRASVTDR